MDDEGVRGRRRSAGVVEVPPQGDEQVAALALVVLTQRRERAVGERDELIEVADAQRSP